MGEGVLIAVRDAKVGWRNCVADDQKRLLEPDAVIIPEKAEVMIQMIHSKRLFDETHIQNRSYLLLE